MAHLNVTSTNTAIVALKDVFSCHSTLKAVMSDNGPQFSCVAFQEFAAEYNSTHFTSSPCYSQANGEAECAVSTVKGLWKQGGDKAKSFNK